MAQRRKALALAGTQLGNILGIQQEDDENRIGQSDTPKATMIGGTLCPSPSFALRPSPSSFVSSINYFVERKENFGDVIGGKLAAVSDFATQNTISQQRKLLPIFTVREQLMNIIREYNVIVIVGM